MKDLNEIIDIIVNRLKSNKIPIWDIYCNHTDIYENQFRKFDIEITRQAVDFYYIIRIFYEKGNNFGVGVVKANSLEPQHLDLFIKQAQQLAKLNKAPKYALPEAGQAYPDIKLAEDKICSDPEGILREKSEELTSVVQDVPQIKPTFGKLRIYISTKALSNSETLAVNDCKTVLFLEYPLKAEGADKLAEFWGRTEVKNLNQLDLQNRIAKWAEIAVDSLHTKVPPPSKSITAIFPPKIVNDAFSNSIGYHATGVALSDGISKFKKGDTIAVESFSLQDNGIMPDGTAVANWDGEGNPQRITSLIEQGVFLNYLFDQKYAKLEKTQSTGNGLRTSDGTIVNSITNLELPAGTESIDELIASVEYGVLIEEFSWLNPSEVTGDFGAEIRNGYLIEHGEKTTPIKGGNLSGNTFEMIKAIEGSSKERITEENYKFPYLKFSGLILSS
jgi:predicted Zn-dependent protease